MFAGGKMRGEAEFKALGEGLSPYPYVLIVEQGKHEKLLYDHIKANGHRRVEWQTELARLSAGRERRARPLRPANGERKRSMQNISSRAMGQRAWSVIRWGSSLAGARSSGCSMSRTSRSTGNTGTTHCRSF